MTEANDKPTPPASPENADAAPAADPKPDAQPQADAPAGPEAIREQVLFGIKGIFDPEIPVNIYDLGLIYRVDVDEAGHVEIDMTLTAPNCPAAQILPAQVQQRAAAVKGVTDVKLEIVWDPPWGPEKMSEAARLQLGIE